VEPPEQPPEETVRAELPSSAALVAFLLCLWGQSLLLFDWARRVLFSEGGSGYLILVAPIFGGATLAAIAAVLLRLRGRRPVGGAVMHALGLASGLLGLTAVVLVLWLGPSVQHGEAASRQAAAREQLSSLSRALDLHLDQQGTYPVGFGAETLAAALAPEYLVESFPMRDPWGSQLHYQSLAGGGGYLLLSAGRDGVQDLTDDEYLTDSPSRRPTNDLVLISGRFVAGGHDVDPR
jgi:hypothetical protein